MMRVLVLMKQVPASATLGVDPETGSLIRNGDTLINPADERALSLALCLSDAQITVLTMGPNDAERLLRTAAAYAPERLVLLSDRAFAGSDTFQTARTICRAAEYLGGFDLILCGRRAVDGETGQVGPELGMMLGLPFASDAIRIERDSDALIIQTQDALVERTLRAPIPCIVSISEGAPALRPASILGLRRAQNAQILTLDNAALQLENCGLSASPTRVKRTRTAQAPQRKAQLLSDVQSGAECILQAWEDMEHV